MKTRSTRRTRRRAATQEKKQEPSFFGPGHGETFFQPAAVNRKAEKQEEKIAAAPEDKKEEKSVQKAPEEKKEEPKVSKKEDKKEEDKMVAKKADPASSTEAGETTARYLDNIEGKGQDLGSTEREYFGERMGYDFTAVRIHTGEEAAESARDAGAKAFTFGNHVVFSQGRYNPESHQGRHLLAHELAHVVQQNPAQRTSPGKATGAAQPTVAAPAPAAVHRQVGEETETTTAPPGTTASVPGTGVPAPTPGPVPAPPGPAAPVATDPATFQSRLRIALAQMTTPTVAAETLSGTLEPVLRDMAAQAEWVDMNGVASGGTAVSVRLAEGGRTVHLRMVLDDAPPPTLAGRFDSTSDDSGTLRIFTQANENADVLATTLYHESLHLMRWLSRHAPGGDLVAETGATGGRRATLEGIDPARQPRHLALVRRRVSDLADSVNVARPATDRIDGAGVDRVADFIMEEYLTRIETEVFRLMRDSDAIARSRHGSRRGDWRGGTLTNQLFPRPDVEMYLLEINSVFRAGDRDALGDFDTVTIDGLYEYFRDRVEMLVRRRYSEVIHGPEYP